MPVRRSKQAALTPGLKNDPFLSEEEKWDLILHEAEKF